MNNIITASQIQHGDTIKVTTVTEDVDRKTSRVYEGVAHESTTNGYGRTWRTPGGWNLYTYEDGAVIELLDRPVPKIELPTGEHAVIQYRKGTVVWTGAHAGGVWKLHPSTHEYVFTNTPTELREKVNNEDGLYTKRTDFKVLFEGVK